MKKVVFFAIILCAGCYTPLNNSGVATTKPWIEIPGKRVDFDGKQYDSCVQFKLRFWPQEAAQRLDLQKACVTACCWRSEGSEIVLDFNKNFEQELKEYGRARKYSPDKITLKVSHSNLVNVTRAAVSPRGAIKNNGLVKLSYKEVEDPKRLAQIARERELADQIRYQPMVVPTQAPGPSPVEKDTTVVVTTTTKKTVTLSPEINAARAKALVQNRVGTQIDTYFYQMNKTYRTQNALFMLSSRLFVPQLQADGSYLVTCHAKARTGIDAQHLNTSDFPCGVWYANLQTQTVRPYDKKAQQIAQ
ncbi:MAG: hypothetical protein J6Y25_03855 [Elusimicrobiaceae bacterium]|nr:hypothetical protein [Elusimicrobiaceae bacterium]MBP5616231.1 hypothetical protein [Elusimicrobiaceae bacterium]